MLPRPAEQGGQLVPGGRIIRAAWNDDVIDKPAFHAPAPGPDIDFDAVSLDVGTRGQEQPRHRHGARLPGFPPIRQPLPFRRVAAFDPCLAQKRVARGAQRLVRPLGRQPFPRDVGPAFPPERRIERREVEADGLRIPGNRCCPPFAAGQHLGLVVLGDGTLASLAVIGGGFGFPLRPAQPIELQPLHRAIMGTGHEVTPLVRCLEFPLDARQPPDRRGRDHEHLAPVREGGGPGFRQRDRIAFLVG